MWARIKRVPIQVIFWLEWVLRATSNSKRQWRGDERNLHDSFEIHHSAILCAWPEVPLGESFPRFLIEPIVNAAQHANFSYAAI